jgi:hypothetical protein
MKKLLSLLAICFSISAFAQNNVTFQVDMNEYAGAYTTVNLNGTFNAWCGPCAVMTETAPGSGVYAITVDIPAGPIEYKFTVDGWAGQESLTPGSSCTVTSGGFTNRSHNVAAATTLDVVCWNSCAACGVVVTSDVTFQVDMNEYANPFTTVYMSGTFNGWSGDANPMSETAPGSGVYALTLTLGEGAQEYKFTTDNWTDQESLTPGASCTVSGPGYTNRVHNTSGDATLDVVCWNSCAACGVVINSDVTFLVNMNDYVDPFTTVYVSGTFNAWSGDANPMTETGPGSGIYTATVSIPNGAHEYKFSLDNWATSENLTPGTSCTITTSGFTNRFINVTGTSSLGAPCYASCDACGINNTSDVTFIVDMSQYTVAFTEVAVFGSFNGWCSGCNPMTDFDGDGIYVVTLTLTNAAYEYKFIVDPTAPTEAAEQFVTGAPCTVGVEFVNRAITVSGDMTTAAFCWESCDACAEPVCQVPTNMDVVEIAFGTTNPRVNATWVNAEGTASCEVKGGRISDASAGTANPVFQNPTNTKLLTQTNGTTVNFNIALYNNPTIPFVIGKTYGYEVRCACADGSGFSAWSGITPGATFVVPGLPATAAVSSTKLLEAGLNAMSVYPNPADAMLNIQMELTVEGSVEINLINALGQTVLQERNSGTAMNARVDVSSLDAGIYMLSLRTSSGVVTERVIIK